IDRKIAEKFGYAHETANVILLAPDGKVILQLRNKDAYDDHLAMYGGHLEVGESHADAALAETKQEAGIEYFKNPQAFIGYESYDEPGDTNRERRSWFLRHLTEEEWTTMKQKKAEDEKKVGASHLTDDRGTYKKKLSQLWPQGKGEVTGVYTFTVDQIAAAPQKPNPQSKLRNKNTRYLTVIDIFQGVTVKTDAFFTPDAFDRLVKNPLLWTKVQEHARAEMRKEVSEAPVDSLKEELSAAVASKRDFEFRVRMIENQSNPEALERLDSLIQSEIVEAFQNEGLIPIHQPAISGARTVVISPWAGVDDVKTLKKMIDTLPENGMLIFSVPEEQLAKAQDIYSKFSKQKQNRSLAGRIKLERLSLADLVRIKINEIGATRQSSRQLIAPREVLNTRFIVPIVGAGAEFLKRGIQLVVIVPEGGVRFDIPGRSISKGFLEELITSWQNDQLALEEQMSSA
ncbi:MAG: NUDIX domain-containing protein, partial [Candidatus Omnitrophica bacterium]|nr:NUDIX domain-containing protein [Candidatus Omnitrophota bacterium]